MGAGSTMLALLCLILLRRTRPLSGFGRPLVSVVLVGMAAAFVLFSQFSERLSSRFVEGAVWDHDPRTIIWKAALTQYGMQPWFGAGARMFYAGCITYRDPTAPAWMQDALFAHNEYLQMLADYGRTGLGLGFLFVLTHAGGVWRFGRWFIRERFPITNSLREPSLGFVVGAASALTASMIHAGFEFQYHVPAVALPAAFFFGILANPGTVKPRHGPLRIPLVRTLAKLSLLGAGLWILWGAGTVGRGDYCLERAKFAQADRGTAQAAEGWLTRGLDCDPLNDALWYQTRGLARREMDSAQSSDTATPITDQAGDQRLGTRQRLLNPYDMFMRYCPGWSL